MTDFVTTVSTLSQQFPIILLTMTTSNTSYHHWYSLVTVKQTAGENRKTLVALPRDFPTQTFTENKGKFNLLQFFSLPTVHQRFYLEWENGSTSICLFPPLLPSPTYTWFFFPSPKSTMQHIVIGHFRVCYWSLNWWKKQSLLKHLPHSEHMRVFPSHRWHV